MLIAQDYQLPDFKNYDIDADLYWPDTLIDHQVEYYDNGSIKTQYIQANGKHRKRMNFWSDGRIKSELFIYQVFTTDTSYLMGSIDPYLDANDPFKTPEIIIDSGYIDIPDGKYIEYHDPSYADYDVILTTGQFKEGNEIGTWQTKKYSGLTSCSIEANFNMGVLNGKYIEYYPYPQNGQDLIKFQGQYSKVKQEYVGPSGAKEIVLTSRRTGEWYYFDQKGNLLETVKYPDK